MCTTGKNLKTTSIFGRCLCMLLILGTIVICIEACSKDEEEIKRESSPTENTLGEGTQGGGQDTIVAPADSLEADVVSQYLKLVNATKIAGQPPTGVDGAIGIDVKDTIYLMRGLPVGDRVSFLHDPAMNVTGFYLYVPGASYYYDVPNVPEEAKDSTDVVYVDADFPVADFKDYPISFPLHIMPYIDGIPFRPFIKPVKIEDPHDPDVADVCNSILRERAGGIEGNRVWQWEFTIRQYNHEILNFWAPGVRVGINVLLGGCCTDNGKSISNADPGGAGCKKDNPSPGFNWVEFPVLDGRTSLWEFMNIWDDGTTEIYGALDEAAIIPDTRNFCTQSVDLTYNIYGREHHGNHDFNPGDNTVNLTFQPYQGSGPVSFLSGLTYNLEYTCNSLVLWREIEGEDWGYVYKRFDPVEFDDFELDWYDNRANPFLIN